MNKDTLVSGLVGVLIGGFLTLILAPNVGGMMGNRNSMIGSNNNMSGNQMMGPIDSHFIEQMIPHHEDAITMAGVALEKSKRPEIKQLAQDINRTQSEEIVKMKNWYKEWTGKDVSNSDDSMGHGMGSGMMHGGMMQDSTDIEKLKTAPDFDKAFLEHMIPHHQMAVMMAQMLQSSTQRSEMKQLAEDIINAQTKEINKMREWYRQWYGQ